MRPTLSPETLDLIVRDYRSNAAERESEDRWWRAEGLPLPDVIDRVGRAVTGTGRRHSHQHRLTPAAIDGCVTALRRIAAQLGTAENFHAVFTLVEDAFGPVHGAGELAVYDAADWLCLHLGHAPKHVVYLHNGARIGARNLAGGRLGKEDAWGVLLRQLPGALRTLSAREAEDVLCIYKDDFLLSPEALLAKWSRGKAGRCKRRTARRCGVRPEHQSSC